ncbi:MAG: hypothetical protein B6240_13945, partial [Desulfobacteraceae bacterium 4572_87]
MKRIYSFEVAAPQNAGGLNNPSKIMVNQARAVDKARLIKRIGHLQSEIIKRI